MRLQATSVGLDPAALTAGEDLVLEADPTHGCELPDGTLIDDYLSIDARRQIEQEAIEATAAWRRSHDAELTVGGLCLPFVWEIPILYRVTELMLKATGLAAALDEHRPETLEVFGGGEPTRVMIEAVAGSRGVRLGNVDQGNQRDVANPRRVPFGRRARRSVLAPLRNLGIPSLLKRSSVLLISYWPTEPLLDRMLSDRDAPRASVLLDKPPAGPWRALRTAARGGWIGTPGPRDKRVGERLGREALSKVTDGPTLLVSGADIGAAARRSILAHAHVQGPVDIARSQTVRRALGRARPAAIVSAWDNHPDARIVMTHAKELGIPTFVIAHGAYLQPTRFRDMNVGDEILIWSDAMERPRPPHDRVHVVGYPVPHEPPPPTREHGGQAGSPRIAVIAQPTLGFALLHGRIEMLQYLTAIDAIAARAPNATVVLRPHPERGRVVAERAVAKRSKIKVEVDSSSPILELLSECDLCIGTASAASLQAALVGTPVIALNMSGYEWLWPLGGGTSVPVARSEDELAGWLTRWLAGEPMPGRDDLTRALGAHGEDASERMLEVIASRIAR